MSSVTRKEIIEAFEDLTFNLFDWKDLPDMKETSTKNLIKFLIDKQSERGEALEPNDFDVLDRSTVNTLIAAEVPVPQEWKDRISKQKKENKKGNEMKSKELSKETEVKAEEETEKETEEETEVETEVETEEDSNATDDAVIEEEPNEEPEKNENEEKEDEKNEKPEKPEKAENDSNDKSPVEKSDIKVKDGRNFLGHKIGSSAYKIDEMMLSGAFTLEELSEKCGVKIPSIYRQISEINKSKVAVCGKIVENGVKKFRITAVLPSGSSEKKEEVKEESKKESLKEAKDHNMKTVFIRAEFSAFHHWDNAPEDFSYMKNTHKHKFQCILEFRTNECESVFSVTKLELQKFVSKKFSENDLGAFGSDKIAEELIRKFKCESVRVVEDGDNEVIVDKEA